MPKATDIKTQSGNGALYATQQLAQSLTTAVTDSMSSIKEIIGDNLGTGHGVFSGANNGKNYVTLEFRSLTAGPGINILGDKDSIVIESTGVLTTNLGDMSGLLPVSKGGTGKVELAYNSLVLGNGINAVQELLPPTTPNQTLLWTGTEYSWVNMPDLSSTPSGTVKSVNVAAGSNKITFTGGPITNTGTIVGDLVESNIQINNLGGILSVAKGGTGATSFQANSLLIGTGSTSLATTPTPSAAGQVLTWAGANFSWTTPVQGITALNATGNTGITASSSVNGSTASLSISLATTGISSGSYTNPTLNVDSFGRIVAIASNPTVTVGGQNLGSTGHILFAGKTGDNLTFKRLEEGSGVSMTSNTNSITVGLSTVPLNKGGTGTTALTSGSLAYVGADRFYSITAAPSGTSSLLGYDGAAYRWYSPPLPTSVTSSTDDISVTSASDGNGTIYSISFNPSLVSLNEFGSVLDSYKGGTGRSSFPVNAIITGNGTSALNHIPSPSTGGVYLSWSGAGYEWKTVSSSSGGVTSITAGGGLSSVANSSTSGGTITTTGSLHIANTGVAPGAYKLLSATVSSTGQITGATDVESTILDRANHTGFMPANRLGGVVSPVNGGTGLGVFTGAAGKLLVVNEAETGYSFTTPSAYLLPTASRTILGGVKIGTSMTISGDGTLDVDSIDYSDINNPPELFSGFYSDLLGRPELFTGDYAALTGAPDLATVATSGSYSDLVGAPALHAVATSGSYLDLVNTPTISLVGETGSYGDLLDIPVPQPATVSNLGVIKIGDGLSVTPDGTVSVNSDIVDGGVTSVGISTSSESLVVTQTPVTSSGVINIELDSTKIDIGSTAGNIAATRVAGLSAVGRTGDYSDLTGVPVQHARYTDSEARSAISVAGDLSYDSSTGVLSYSTPEAVPGFSGAYSDLTGKPTFSIVATSGSYDDLTDVPEPVAAYTDSMARLAISTSGDLAYDSITGVISYTAEPAFSGAYADLTGAPTLFSGNYADLTNKPTIPSIAGLATTVYVDDAIASAVFNSGGGFTGNYNDLFNAPVLATVATSGDYNDLTNKPVNTSYTDDQARAAISVTGSLSYNSTTGVISYVAPAGFSGAYADLTGKPTIPTQYTDSMARLALSGSGDIAYNSTTGVISYVGSAGFSGDYNDLTNKPTIPSIAGLASTAYVDSAVENIEVDYDDLTNKPTIPSQYTDTLARAAISVAGDLAYDAATGIISYSTPAGTGFSGDYNDLTNKPTIPQAFSGAYSDLTGLPVLSTVATSGNYGDLINKPTLFSGAYADLTGKPTIPTQYTDALARASISVTGSATYNSTTGVINVTGSSFSGDYNDLTNKPVIPAAFTVSDARSAISLTPGTSGASYNSTTGVLNLSSLVTGETNTASNVGAGAPVFKGKVGVDLQFKSIVAGTNITLVQGTDTITINSAGGAGGGSPVPVQGSGTEVVAAPSAINFTGAGVAVTDVGGVATVNIPGGAGSGDSTEWVEMRYTAGTTGTFNYPSTIKAYSSGVSLVEVIDAEQCKIRITMPGKSKPPASVSVFGYNSSTFYWTAQPYSPAVGQMTINVDGATKDNDLFPSGAVTRYITLTLPMAQSGVVGRALTNARVMVTFAF